MNFLIQAAKAPKAIARSIANAPYNKGDSLEKFKVNSEKKFKSVFTT